MSKSMLRLAITLFCLLGMAAAPAFSAVKEGDKELFVFGSLTNSAGATTIIAAVGGGLFISDTAQVGGQVQGLIGDSFTALFLDGTYKHHINPGEDTVPYFGGQVGFSIFEAGGFSSSSMTITGLGGAKMFLSENTSLNPELRYILPLSSGSEGTLMITVGLSTYFD